MCIRDSLKDTEYAANDVISEFPTEICYKEKEDDIHFYNTVEACISICLLYTSRCV